MAVSNDIGSVIAKYVIGESPAICYDEDHGRYHIVTYSNELVYRQIMDESARCGMKVYRDTIDKVIIDLHGHNEYVLQHSMLIYGDNEILPGECIRLYSKESIFDLIKIRSRYYICIGGPLKGKYITTNSDSLDFKYDGRDYAIGSMAFLVPSDVFTIIDYKYLKIYRSVVADDISDIYNEVNMAVFNGNLTSEFGNLLTMCADAGISVWTLMGMIDHSMTTTNGDE